MSCRVAHCCCWCAQAKSTRRSKFVKEVVREVAGFAPYERRLIDLCRNNLDKRALRLAKRYGTTRRAAV